MYIFYLTDGTVLGTSSLYMCQYIRDTYDVETESFIENLDEATDTVDYVLE